MRDFSTLLDEELKIAPSSGPLVLDLFAGCGGLALGFEAAGFRTVGYEMDPDACETYKANLHGNCHCVILDENTNFGINPDVIIAGPPCQPFSVGGLQKGKGDKRNGFPAYLAAIAKIQPSIAIFENVRGMFYRGRPYLEKIFKTLKGLGYEIDVEILNAANYGVPQRRERLFVVAHKGGWHFPIKQEAPMVTAGDAIGDYIKKTPKDPRYLTSSMDAYVLKYEIASKCIKPRDLHLDQPSRTLTCRNLNGATGDMMRIRMKNGRRRRLTFQEAARLQSFPDWFEFLGSEGSKFNQIGNAVPPLLAKAVASSAIDYLKERNIWMPSAQDSVAQV